MSAYLAVLLDVEGEHFAIKAEHDHIGIVLENMLVSIMVKGIQKWVTVFTDTFAISETDLICT